MSYQFIISKFVALTQNLEDMQLTRNRRLDPIFAVSIGLAAAVTRINREEREKGRSTTQSMDVLKRRWNLAWQDDKKL
jgi:hypothetical protein